MNVRRSWVAVWITAAMGLLGVAAACTPTVAPTATEGPGIGQVSPTAGVVPVDATPVPPTAAVSQFADTSPTPDAYLAEVLTLIASAAQTEYVEQATFAATVGYPTLPPFETYVYEGTQRVPVDNPTPIPTFEMDIPSGEYVPDPASGEDAELPPLVVITDPEYVRDEVFAVYRRFLEYVRFESGPPGEDVAERLAEFMVTDEALIALADESGDRTGALAIMVPGGYLENCAYPEVLRAAQSQLGNRQYVRALIRTFETLGWRSEDGRDPYALDLPENGVVSGRMFADGFIVGLNGLTFGQFTYGTSPYADFELVDMSSGSVLGRTEGRFDGGRRNMDYDIELYKPVGQSQWKILRASMFFCSDAYSRLVNSLENAGP